MESLGWRWRRGSSPAAQRGARKRAGLTPASTSNTISCERETLHPKPNQKIPLTVITVSTATAAKSGRRSQLRPFPDTVNEATNDHFRRRVFTPNLAHQGATLLRRESVCHDSSKAIGADAGQGL